MKKLLIGLFFLITITSAGQSIPRTPGNCDRYTKDGNRVVFHCDNGAAVMLQLCSQRVLKVWYEPSGVFHRANESFAVINESLDPIYDIHIEEQAQAYEIFTSDLRIRVNRRPFRLQIFDKYQKLLFGDYEDKGLVSDSLHVYSGKVLRSDEQFFGLGEKAGPLNRRGRSYTMWNSDKPCYSETEDPLYKSIPFFISSYRYGIFFDNTYKARFDFGSRSDSYYSFEAPGGEMIYYFIYGHDYKKIINDYMRLTGNPIMPPKWAFGFSQCRGLLTREDLTRGIAQEYRKRNIPCDIIYQDIGWTQGLQNFEWRKENYHDPRQMLRDLDDMGFKVVVSQDPVVSQVTTDQWKEADSLGYFVKDVRTGKTYDMPWPWGGNCGVVDFTDPKVASWWGDLQQKPIADGVRGFWTDMGEPAWSNEESTDRLNMQHRKGMHDEIHNVYGLEWDRVVTEQFEKHNPGKRIFQMTRAGYAGLQRYTFGWSGDAGNGNDVNSGWSRLANQIPIGLSAGMGLIPFWSCDISGYCGDITDYPSFSELYLRWLQFGIFNPISRAHHEGNNAVEPWLFGEEVERLAKEAIELKYRLFPYIYTYAREAYDTGIPLMRAMLLEFPNDAEACSREDQFMFGKSLLVAPVVEKGARTRKIYFPEGTWVDFNDDKTVYKGPALIDYPVTLETIPIFVRKGSVIPMMPVMQYIHERPAYPVTFKIFGNDGPASFTLYEDDGETVHYKDNIFSRTLVSVRPQKEGIEVVFERQNNGYSPAERNFIIEQAFSGKPSFVKVNGVKVRRVKLRDFREATEDPSAQIRWSYDPESGTCLVSVPDSGSKTVITIAH